ncbi:hypothetical protein Tsubulata_031350 [Turnera subulata]|uniref:Potassium transporter n=1 Tax=Turnera subulata TaxID=218843 RepID=A0A9Q0FQP1_9ROSI|nr:hypothetical protein Tsubulata_031350 [Turnera subulata]
MYSDGLKVESWRHTAILSFQTLGIVYGRLSTAPLYVFGTIRAEEFKSDEAAYEYFSFIFWTLTIISLLKYAFIVLKVDDNGEGGPFALYSLLCRHAKVGLIPNDRSTNEVMVQEEGSAFRSKLESRARRALKKHKSSHYLMLFSAVLGACFIIADGVLTPSISVLSASTGLQRSLSEITYSHSDKRQESISDDLKKYVPVPVACVILVCLFLLQHYGTLFVMANHMLTIYSSGSEAMFANLGHFSKKSIKITFVCVIYPLLVLCYAGQAAFISRNFLSQDFNHLSRSVPKHLRHVFILLSLLASVVGSQATITATFSIIKQCLALSCFPRTKVIHTSDKRHGQVYIPDVNWLLMTLSLAITIGFNDPTRIANAAGLAIISGMIVTTCLMSLVIALYWEKSLYVAVCFLTFFGFIEAVYLSACLLNFHKGAWFLVVLVASSFTMMLSWHYGTMKKYEFDLQNKVPTEWLTELSPGLGVSRVPGIGFIYTDLVTGIPAFFSHFITNLPAFHEVLIFVSFKSLPEPHVPANQRYLVGRVGTKDHRVYRCIVRYGYCDRVRDTDDFEEQIIGSIGEFVSLEENDIESMTSHEGKMMVVGKPLEDGNALIPLVDTDTTEAVETGVASVSTPRGNPERKKKVRFMLPANSPKMQVSVRKELEHLIEARESGTAYFLGQSHLKVREGSNYLKKFLIMAFVFLDKNCREPPVALNIPHAALVEVSTVYTI